MVCGCRGHGQSQILFALGQAEKRSPRHANCRLAPPHALLQQASCASAAQEEIQQLCRQGHLDLAIHVMCHLQCPTTDSAYMSLLDACSKNKALQHAQQVHIHLTKHDLILTCPLGNYLVETFVKCGSIDDALHVFHQLPHHTVLSWTAIISAYTESGRAREALKFHHLMLEECVQPNRFTYITLLKACSSISALEEGRNIHDALRKKGFVSNVFVGSALVNMYGKCGSIKEAEIVFCELPVRNVVTWNALLSAYIEQNDGERALRLYRQMHQEGMCPYERTYVIALQACSIFAEMEEASSVEKQKVISLEIGRAVHVDAVKNGATASDVFMGSALLSMYGKSGSFTEAENVLSELPKHYTVFWNVLLSAYVKHKQGKKALHLYTKMLHEGTSPDELIFVAVLQACVIFAENENSSFVDGRPLKVFCSEVVKALHQDAQTKGFCSDIFLASTLINAHGSCGNIIDAETVFQGLFKRDIVTWNSMLSAYIDQGQGEKALWLYRQMQEECTVKEERTSVIALQACCILAEQDSYINLIPGQSIKAMSLSLGQAVHADARRKGFDSEIFICNTLVSMYSKCGDIENTENVFYGMSKRDKLSWCAMLTAYLEHDEAEKALWLFRQMQVDGMILDKLHYVVAFQACGSLAEEEEAVFVEEHSIKLCSLRISQAIHAYAEVQNFISDVIVGSTLVSVYGKCGAIKEAHSVFNELFRRDIVAWNAMLSAFLEQGLNHDALSLFIQIQKEGVTLDSVTFLCILHACSETENEEICRQLHFIIAASEYDTGLILTNSLIHAYGSCASMGNAKVVFDGLHQGDVVSWTACISGNARIGDFAASLQIFEAMVSMCISPDEVTFLSLLSACSHAGLVHEGVQYFESITGNYGIAPNLKHFAGMIDLLGRAGNFKKMENLLNRMPVKADLTTWVTLLAVCCTHGNSELGKHAFECAVHIQPMEAMSYILMSNIYAEAGLQDCCE